MKFISALMLMACGCGLELHAQQDTIVVKDSLEKKKFFNALDYSMQKRYRPKNSEFVSNRWADNSFLEFRAGAENFIHRDGTEIGFFKNVSLAYGKMFSPLHGIRIAANGGFSEHKRSDYSYTRLGAQADYLFDIYSYIKGYRTDRTLGVSTIMGLGYTYETMTGGDAFHVGDFHAGVQLRVKLMPRVDFILEPTVAVYSDGIDHYTKNNWHKYDVGYGLMMGLKCNLGNIPEGRRFREDEGKNMFVSLAAGIQYQYSDIVREMGIMKSLGPHIELSGGKWLLPYLGVRLSAFYGDDVWNTCSESIDGGLKIVEKLKSRYFGGRVEAMVSVFDFTELEFKNKFRLSVLGGVEAACMMKKDISQSVDFAYYGLTAGIQVKYNINRKWGIFVEPRYSYVPYTYVPKSSNGEVLDDRNKYSDNIYNFNIGVEYSF